MYLRAITPAVFAASLCIGLGSPAMAQTPDGETPAVETVCDILTGPEWGLCNAYCEAMDCDGIPVASQNACDKVRANFERKTGGDTIPCEEEVSRTGRVFLSSATFDGAQVGNAGNGAFGGDQICQGLADAAVLGGTWFAWLSDSTTSPSVRFNQSLGPFELLDGTLIANDWADLTDGAIANFIDLNELGGGPVFGSQRVWTGTFSDGTPVNVMNAGNFCGNWSSTVPTSDVIAGRVDKIDDQWSRDENFGADCDVVRPLYCFEQ